jgi:MoxR-like ATPase
VASGAELEAARALVRDLPAAENVVDYALRLVRATRPDDETAPPVIKDWVKWGAGPRAGQALLLGAKAMALMDCRPVPAPEDIEQVTGPVMRHRIVLNFQAEADGIDADQVIGGLLEAERP